MKVLQLRQKQFLPLSYEFSTDLKQNNVFVRWRVEEEAARERPGPGPARHSVMLLPRWIGVSIGSRAHLEREPRQPSGGGGGGAITNYYT